MTVIGISGSPRADAGLRPHGARATILLKVAAELDFLVALTPLTPETRGIVGEKVLAAMKPSAYLVNVARGGVVDEPALIKALESGPDRRRRARRVLAGAAAARQSAVEDQERDDLLASRRLFGRLRGPRHADDRRQHAQSSSPATSRT